MTQGRIALAQGDTGTAIPAFERAADLCRERRYEHYLTLAGALLRSAPVLAGRVAVGLTSLREAGCAPTPMPSIWLMPGRRRADRRGSAS